MELILIRGLPGSGKTTVAKEIRKVDNYIILEADMFFEDINGNYNFDPKLIGEAHKWCQKTCEALLKQDFNVVVSNTFTQLWEMQPYIEIAKKLNISPVVYRMNTQYTSIHNVPQETINKMKERFEDFEGEIVR